MPYKWNEYVSTYVDPQSVKISEILRTRFMENFKANDALASAVDQMKAALPFENDVKRKAELQKEIDDKLNQLSERGDYENLGFAVHRASKEFAEKYTPIKENYERYQNAIAAIDEQYKKGDINSEQYNLSSAYITKNYKGFEIDPTTGKAKEGSFFSAPTIYKDPKIMDLMTKRLEILQMKKRGSEGAKVVTDENGTFKVKSGVYTEEIPQEDVMDVYNSVIREADVAAYLSQFADMKTVAANKSGQTPAILQAQKDQNQQYLEKLQVELGKTKNKSAREQYTTAIKALNDTNTKIDEALQNPDLASDLLRNYFYEATLQPVKEYAMKKAGLFTYKTEYDIAGIGGGGDGSGGGGKAQAVIPLYQFDKVRADMDVSGTTTKAKTQYIVNTDKQIADLQAELKNNPNYSDKIKASIQANINSLVNNKNRVTAQIKEAADSSISWADLQKVDNKIVSIMRRNNPKASTGEIYTMIERTFDNAGDQDYMDFKKDFDKVYGQGEFDKHTTSGAFVKRGIVTKFSPEEKAMAAGMALAGQEYTYDGGYKGVLDKFQYAFSDKINKKYAEIKQSHLYNMGRIETGMGYKMDMATTNAVHGFFLERPLNEEEIVTVELEDGTVKQLHGGAEELKGYKIQQVGWQPTENTFKINLVRGDGEKATPLTAIYDGSQIINEGLQAAMNSPEVRFGAAVMAQRSMTPGVARELTTVKINGKPVNINIYSRGDESPYISITNKDGSPYLEADKATGAATKHYLDEPVIKNLINGYNVETGQAIVTGY